MALQTAATTALLWWIFRDPEVRRGAAHALREADAGWMWLAVAAAGITVIAGGVRWFIFLRILGLKLTLGRTMAISFVGAFFNLFFFGSIGGDAAKAVCVRKDHPSRFATALLSIVMDHMSGFVVVLFLALTLTFMRLKYFMGTPLATSMVGILAVVMGFTLLGIVLSLALARLNLAAKLPLPQFARQKMMEVDRAFNALTHRWGMSLIGCGVSVAVTLSYFLIFYCSSRAIGGGVSVTEVLTVMPVVDVVSALPISISGLGVREKSFEELLGAIAGVPVETAVMISLGGFAASLFWGLVGGVVFCFYRRSPDAVTWHEIRDVRLSEVVSDE